MKSKNLKRLAAFALFAVLCLTAVACGKQDGKNDIASSSSSEASERETIEAGNNIDSAKDEPDAAQTKESAAPQQAVSPAKATEKSTEKKTEKQTEKQTATPKTEPHTPAKKKMTQAEVDRLNQGVNSSALTDNGLEAKYSLRGNSLVISIIAISDKQSDDRLIAYFNSTESLIGNEAKKFLKEYDIDSFIYEAVNKDGKTICSKEYK